MAQVSKYQRCCEFNLLRPLSSRGFFLFDLQNSPTQHITSVAGAADGQLGSSFRSRDLKEEVEAISNSISAATDGGEFLSSNLNGLTRNEVTAYIMGFN